MYPKWQNFVISAILRFYFDFLHEFWIKWRKWKCKMNFKVEPFYLCLQYFRLSSVAFLLSAWMMKRFSSWRKLSLSDALFFVLSKLVKIVFKKSILDELLFIRSKDSWSCCHFLYKFPAFALLVLLACCFCLGNFFYFFFGELLSLFFLNTFLFFLYQYLLVVVHFLFPSLILLAMFLTLGILLQRKTLVLYNMFKKPGKMEKKVSFQLQLLNIVQTLCSFSNFLDVPKCFLLHYSRPLNKMLDAINFLSLTRIASGLNNLVVFATKPRFFVCFLFWGKSHRWEQYLWRMLPEWNCKKVFESLEFLILWWRKLKFRCLW